MTIFTPHYYNKFKCTAGKCQNTCCKGWEIEIDEESLERFLKNDYIKPHIDLEDTPKFRLSENEVCPFLNSRGLCDIIIKYGENMLCDICRDHPRFRNYWTDRTEIGLGLVCEEAARLILTEKEKMKIVPQSKSLNIAPLPDDEQWLWDLRENLLNEVYESGPAGRLKEYLIFRHIPDSLYDGLLEERIKFINDSFDEITEAWNRTDGTINELVRVICKWSYDTEYDDEAINRKLTALSE